MAWLSRNNVAPTDSLTADMLNSLANDIRFWGGDVNAGGYRLTNVILSGSGGFERIPSPVVIAPVAAGGSSEVQLTDYVAGSPDTFPPRWKMTKGAQPVADFAIERYNNFGSLIDKPLSIRMADGIVVLKAQQWTAQVNADGQTITNVVIGSGSTVPWTAVTGAPSTFPPGPHTHAAADTTSGIFAVARLGTGTPDSTKYLRGDGSWSAVATQTPWTQDVDAAGFSLQNVKFGFGTIFAAQLAGYNIYYDNGWKKLADGPGLAMLQLAGGGGAALYASPTVTGGAAIPVPTQAIIFRDNNVVEIPRTVQIKSTTFFPDDSTKYLRGDGVWSVPPGAGGGQPQTPWAQNIDGAGFDLYKAGTAQFSQNHPPPSGSGVEIAYDTIGHIVAYDRTAAAYKELRLYGVPLSLYAGGTAALRVDSGKVSITAPYFYPQKTVMPPPAFVSWNLTEESGAWRYLANGYASIISAYPGAGEFRVWSAASGAAGAVASPVPVFTAWPTGLIESASAQFKGDGTSSMAGPGVELFYLPDNGGEGRIQAYDRPSGGFKALLLTGAPIKLRDLNGAEVMRTDIGKVTVAASSIFAMGNSNGERIILFDGGGGTGPTQNTSMGIESNAWWFKCHSAGNFRWYVGNPPDGGPSVKAEINGYGLTVKGTVCVGGGNAMTLNAHYTDTWRYQGPGNAPAFAMYGDWNMNSIRIMAGVTGAPGNAIAFTETMQMHPSFVKVLVQFALGYVPTSASGLASGSVWRDAAAGNVLKIVP